MRRLVGCVACVAVLAAVASGNEIRIRFGQPEFVPPTSSFGEYLDPLPPSYPGGSTVTLGVWADINCDISNPADPIMDVWNRIGVNIISDAGPSDFHVNFLRMDNFDHRIGAGTTYRWDDEPNWSDFGHLGPPAGFDLVSSEFNRYGLGGLWPREWEAGSWGTDWWSYTIGTPGAPGSTYHYWLGNATIYGSAANVYFQIGSNGITRQGGDPDSDLIYFGADETVPLLGTEYGAISSQPDLVFEPEPGALVLLSLAALVMRRR
jgi:hypothetical protein